MFFPYRLFVSSAVLLGVINCTEKGTDYVRVLIRVELIFAAGFSGNCFSLPRRRKSFRRALRGQEQLSSV